MNLRARSRVRVSIVAAAALLSSACSTVSSVIGDATGSTQKEEQAEKVTRIQAEVMAFADVYVGEVLASTSRIPAASAEDQVQLLGFQVRQSAAAFEIASGENPVTNLFDMVILVASTRAVVESYWNPKVFGAPGQPLSAVLARLEPKIWTIAGQIMDAKQEASLRGFVLDWLARNPDVHDVASIRIADLASMLRSTSSGLGSPNDVLKATGLDPFGGIDPAVLEVQRTRVLAERAFYFAKRWPRLLDLQTRLLTVQLSLQPAPSRSSPT